MGWVPVSSVWILVSSNANSAIFDISFHDWISYFYPKRWIKWNFWNLISFIHVSTLGIVWSHFLKVLIRFSTCHYYGSTLKLDERSKYLLSPFIYSFSDWAICKNPGNIRIYLMVVNGNQTNMNWFDVIYCFPLLEKDLTAQVFHAVEWMM